MKDATEKAVIAAKTDNLPETAAAEFFNNTETIEALIAAAPLKQLLAAEVSGVDEAVDYWKFELNEPKRGFFLFIAPRLTPDGKWLDAAHFITEKGKIVYNQAIKLVKTCDGNHYKPNTALEICWNGISQSSAVNPETGEQEVRQTRLFSVKKVKIEIPKK